MKIWELQEAGENIESLELKSEFERWLRRRIQKAESVEINVDFPGQTRKKYIKTLNDKWKAEGLKITVIATEDQKISALNEFASGV